VVSLEARLTRLPSHRVQSHLDRGCLGKQPFCFAHGTVCMFHNIFCHFETTFKLILQSFGIELREEIVCSCNSREKTCLSGRWPLKRVHLAVVGVT